MRYVVVIHEVEGVIKEDAFVGPFRDEARALRKAAAVERGSQGLLQARVEIIDPGTTPVKAIISLWGQRLIDSVARFRAEGERVNPDGSQDA